MKSYVDLDQARKLAEILPLESADMCYIKGKAHLGFLYEEYKELGDSVLQEYEPCWSLSSLLMVIPKPSLFSANDGKEWYCNAEPNKMYFSGRYDNPVDACYEMIVKLYKMNLL